MTVEQFLAQVKAGVIKHVGLPESVAMVADSLNLPVEQITETIEPKISTERVQTEFSPSKRGRRPACTRSRAASRKTAKNSCTRTAMYVGAKDPADTISLTGHRTSACSFLAARMATLRRLRWS